jgi:hypothetical protein
MPASEDRERRTHFRGKPRPGRRVEVEYRVGGDGAPRKAHTRNIGVGGAFIVTEAPEPPGTALDVSLLVGALSGTGRIDVRAEVRWAVQDGDLTGMGVKFLALEVDALLALNEYFASLTGDE